jgi:hypothetical protein
MAEFEAAAVSNRTTTETTLEMNGTTFHRVVVTQDGHESEQGSDDVDSDDDWEGKNYVRHRRDWLE